MAPSGIRNQRFGTRSVSLASSDSCDKLFQTKELSVVLRLLGYRRWALLIDLVVRPTVGHNASANACRTASRQVKSPCAGAITESALGSVEDLQLCRRQEVECPKPFLFHALEAPSLRASSTRIWQCGDPS